VVRGNSRFAGLRAVHAVTAESGAMARLSGSVVERLGNAWSVPEVAPPSFGHQAEQAFECRLLNRERSQKTPNYRGSNDAGIHIDSTSAV
jgi:hypothetical protein